MQICQYMWFHSNRGAGLQEVMEEPVLAADGFSYERSAILQWLQLGHTTSPMTNEPLQHPGLTSNRALRAAIQQWKTQPVHV